MSEVIDINKKDILRRMLADIANTEDKTPNSMIYDSLSSMSIEQLRIYEIFGYLTDKYDISNLHDYELDRRIREESGLYRKEATYAKVNVIVKGIENTKIPPNIIGVAYTDDGEVQFMSAEGSVIKDGQAELEMTCMEKGRVGLIEAREIEDFGRTYVGLTEITNLEKATDGFDEESDEEFRERHLTRMRYPGRAGNLDHYREWATEVIGIGYAKAERCFNGPLTVKVTVVDQNKGVVSEDKIKETYEHIKGQMPFGVEELLVESAVGYVLNVSTKVKLVGGYSLEEVEKNIKNKLKDYLIELGFMENYISYAKISALIMSAEGVNDYIYLTINNITENIQLGSNQTPVLGEIEVTNE